MFDIRVLILINNLTPWCMIIFEHIIVAQLVKKFSSFYATRNQFLCSQDLDIGSAYPETLDSSVDPHNLLF